MNSISSAYAAAFDNRIVTHFPARQLLVRDMAEDELRMRLHAKVRSGDYFVTLATELERIAQNLDHISSKDHSEGYTKARGIEAGELERIVSELLIISKVYTVTKK